MAVAKDSKVDVHGLSLDVDHKLSRARALCVSIGAASRSGGDLPTGTIDMSLDAVSDLLEDVREQVACLYAALRTKEDCHA